MTAQEWREIEEILAAAVELPLEEWASYVARCCAGRPSVRAEVEAMLSLRSKANAAFQRSPTMPSAESVSEVLTPAGERFGPYRVVRLLGAGGMGEVYLAERDDDQFRRQVAIKMVASSIANPEVFARFHSEHRILAALDHPNIARLLDAGMSENGRPFFIMEYVDGVPLMEFCRTRDLSLHGRLQLFRTVCSAVHFAHQNLIVHRDLKPGNILISADGTPKLLDFGIAKILDPSGDVSAALTLASAHPMTPEYASPEQLRGSVITTASDIYTLGCLLYELLTGRRPFDFQGLTVEQAALLITGAEPPRPSRSGSVWRNELAGDLDSITLKALRIDPRERYGSAEDLSADIGRYLDGSPVLARRGTFYYVARKFVARHRTAMATAITAIVLLAGGGVALVHSARVAESERAKAQERFNQVHQLANTLLFELHDGIAVLPGSNNVRRQLVARALQYLETLEKTSSGDPALQLNLAQSYERLGSVQGHISEMNLGDPRGALASYGRGIEILQRIPASARIHNDIVKELATLHLLRRDVFRDLRENRERDHEYEQALAIVAPLKQRFPEDAGILTLYSTVFFGQAKALSAEDPEAARQLFLRSMAVDSKLLQGQPNEGKYQRDVALDHKFLSSVLSSHEDALNHLREAQALDEKRIAAEPNNAQAKLDLSFDLSEMSSHLAQTGDLTRAWQLARQVQTIRTRLASADPQDAQLRLRVITAGKGMAEVLVKMGRFQEALREYRIAAQRAEEAVSSPDPRNREVLAEIEMGIASTEETIATDSAASGNHRQRACRAYARAAEILGSLVSEGVATPEEASFAKRAAHGLSDCRKS